MKELNPTIKSFYEKKYNTPVKTQSNSYYYVEVENNSVIFLVFKGELIKKLMEKGKPNWNFAGLDIEFFKKFDDEENVYLFNQGAHTEDEMLRLIKMKAFL